MSNKQVLNYVKDWLERKRIKSYFTNKRKRKTKYIKIEESDFYEFCSKLIDLVNNNIE